MQPPAQSSSDRDAWEKQQEIVFNNRGATLKNAHRELESKGNYVARTITSQPTEKIVNLNLQRPWVLPDPYRRPVAVRKQASDEILQFTSEPEPADFLQLPAAEQFFPLKDKAARNVRVIRPFHYS
ncbi:hypothetical protein Anapl_09501 [Anas platyrhynchos]|uniref:Uncharacterized protein n=1 Tax=Anas platyrhynchos TaxID=8839 RepID=R0LFG3_ANAPL|nr:hypothetical protein Anapl_09501 [Anas platyrhynchos]